MDEAATLSLADVARLAGVARPVVSMWRRRPLAGHSFPAPTPDGRFDAEAITTWLEQTRRGKNGAVRADLAVHAVVTATTDVQTIKDLTALLAARVVLDQPLAPMDPESLLDDVEALDPDDTWLFSDVSAADVSALAADADAIADATWDAVNGYERLLDVLHQRQPADPAHLSDQFVTFLADLTRSLLADPGVLVDVQGTASDTFIALIEGDDFPDAEVRLVGDDAACRLPRQRYRVHGTPSSTLGMKDAWRLPDGSVVLAQLPHDLDTALDTLDDVALQLSGSTCAIVTGPAAILTDPLPAAATSRRDRHLREHNVIAIARLGQGLTNPATREHTALWLLRANAPRAVATGDLSGQPLTRSTAQTLRDDLVAACGDQRLRAFSQLHPTGTPELLIRSGSLVTIGAPRSVDVPPSAADDAVTLLQLIAALRAPVVPPFEGLTPVIGTNPKHQMITLGDAVRTRRIKVVSGHRVGELPVGTIPLWDAEAVASRQPGGVDLLSLAASYRDSSLTERDDVIFTAAGKPAAVVDARGGSVVAYPARVLRVSADAPLSPRAIAETINCVPAGNSKWRTWEVPVVHGAKAPVEELLKRVDDYALDLRTRQTHVDELRHLLIRSVLPGAVTLTSTHQHQPKGL